MAPNERAQKAHDALFPGHVSSLAATDIAALDSNHQNVPLSFSRESEWNHVGRGGAPGCR